MKPLQKRFFSTGQLHLIERLLREQGTKHYKGYVVAFAMMGVIAATTTASAYLMGGIVNRIFVDRNIQAMWAIGGAITAIYVAKGFATYGQQVILSRIRTTSSPRARRRFSTRCSRWT